FGYDPAHSFFNTGERILDPSNVGQLENQWSFAVGSQGIIVPMSPAAAVGRRVYVGSSNSDGKLYAFDAVTGEVVWSASTPNQSAVTAAAVAGGRVFAASLDGFLYAWPTTCADPCAPLWSVAVGRLGTNSPPTIADGVIYIGGYDGNVYAFDAGTGDQFWTARINPAWTGDPVNIAPAVAGPLVLVAGDFATY